MKSLNPYSLKKEMFVLTTHDGFSLCPTDLGLFANF